MSNRIEAVSIIDAGVSEQIDLGEAIGGEACYDEHGAPMDEPGQFDIPAIVVSVARA